MSDRSMTVLVVGATGSIGRLVVEEVLRQGHAVRALVRNRARGDQLPDGVEIVPGDLTRPETLRAAVDGVEAIVFTHGSDDSEAAAEEVDYGGVRELLAALGGRQARIALMTAIGISYAAVGDWKRRSERLVRASGLPCTIVRPGWFDYNDADQHRLEFLQGDTRHAGDSSDGVIARRFPGFAAHEELRMLQRAGLSPFEALAAGTRNAGEFIARFAPGAAPFGMVRTGHRADFIITDANPLDNLNLLREPAAVVVHGRILDRTQLESVRSSLKRDC